MIKIAKAAVALLFLAVITMGTAKAQTTNTYSTNVLLNLTFSLTPYEQQYIPVGTKVITLGAGELTSVGTTATVTHTAHGFTTGQFVTVSGATPAAYNGTYQVTVTGADTFTYTFAGGTSPATGTITCGFSLSAPTAATGKVVTDGIIRAIAKYLSITGDVSNAKLYMRLSWTNALTNITSDIIIRRGAQDTVVNNSILVDLPIALLRPNQSPDSVSTLRATLAGTTNVTDYANCKVQLFTGQGSFNLNGIATVKSASLFNGRTLIDLTPFPTSFTVSVAGSGSLGFHQAEWKGTVMGSGQKVEFQQVSP